MNNNEVKKKRVFKFMDSEGTERSLSLIAAIRKKDPKSAVITWCTACAYELTCEKFPNPTDLESSKLGETQFSDFCARELVTLDCDYTKEDSNGDSVEYEVTYLPAPYSIETTFPDFPSVESILIENNYSIRIKDLINKFCKEWGCSHYTENYSKCNSKNVICPLNNVFINKSIIDESDKDEINPQS